METSTEAQTVERTEEAGLAKDIEILGQVIAGNAKIESVLRDGKHFHHPREAFYAFYIGGKIVQIDSDYGDPRSIPESAVRLDKKFVEKLREAYRKK